jgi:hypothetical protein
MHLQCHPLVGPRTSRHEGGKWMSLAEIPAMQSCTLNGYVLTGNEVSILAFDMGLGMLYSMTHIGAEDLPPFLTRFRWKAVMILFPRLPHVPQPSFVPTS